MSNWAVLKFFSSTDEGSPSEQDKEETVLEVFNKTKDFNKTNDINKTNDVINTNEVNNTDDIVKADDVITQPELEAQIEQPFLELPASIYYDEHIQTGCFRLILIRKPKL
jgi:hypothetical protein